MERSGDRAGERAGKAASKRMNEELAKGSSQFERDFHQHVDGINKALGGINTNRLSNDLRKEIAEVKRELSSLSNVDITAEADFKRVFAQIAVLEGRVQGLRDNVKIVFRGDIDHALKSFAKIAAAKEAIDDPVEIEVHTDTRSALREMSSFEKSFKKIADKAAGHLSGSMGREAKRIKEDLAGLQHLRIGVDISGNQARAELAALAAELHEIATNDPEIDVRVDAARAHAELAAFILQLDRIDGRDVTADVNVDTDRAQRGMFGLRNATDGTANAFRSFNVIVLAVAGAGPALVPMLAAVAGGLLALGPAAAVGGAALGSVLVGFSGLGDALTALQSKQDHAATSAQSGAKSQASAARTIENAERALANARRSAAQSAEAAADRVRDAQRNAARAAADAARAVQDAQRDAARAAEDAAERVKEAREQAAEAIKNALEQQAQAQDDYRDSVQDVQDAEEALRQARADAQGTGEDLSRQIRENALAIDQALLDSFDATVTYNAVLADGSSTNAEKEQARIDREQALLNLEELRAQQKELAEEKKHWDEEGVNGTEAVQAAQDNLNDALAAQQAAYEALAEAAKDVDKARSDGAKDVADAIREQNQVLADNSRAIKDAQRAQRESAADNARSIRDAKEAAAESAADNARAIADAQRALADAHESGAMALDGINAQQQAVNAAFDKLGPAGRKFALFLFGLRKGFYEFRDAVQQVMLPAVQQAIEGFINSPNAKIASRALIGLAGAFGQFTKRLSKSFQGKAWGDFFQMLADFGPRIMRAYGGAFIKFMEGMATIMVVMAPFALKLARGFERLMTAFADWAASKEGQDAILNFMDYVKGVAPAVLDFFGALFDALVNILVSLAPYGEVVLGALTGFLELVAGMDPDVLGPIVSAILALVAASQIAYAVISGLAAGITLLTSPIGLIVFAVAGIALAIGYLYKRNEGFRKFVQKAWKEISASFKDAWEKYIKPALDQLGEAFGKLWDRILKPFFVWLSPIIIWLAKAIIPQIGFSFMVIASVISHVIDIVIGVIEDLVIAFDWAGRMIGKFVDAILWVVDKVAAAFMWLWDFLFGHSVIPDIVDGFIWAAKIMGKIFKGIGGFVKILGKAFSWLWKNVARPVLHALVIAWKFTSKILVAGFQLIKTLWEKLLKGMKVAWEHVLRPAWDALGDIAERLWKKILKPVFEFIGDKWEKILKAMKWYWTNVLKPMWSALGDAAGRLWKNVLKPAFENIGDKWDSVLRDMKWVWNNVLKPVFNFITDTALPGLETAFENVVGGIKTVWDGLKKAVGAPIKFVLDTVINKGLIDGFNKVANWVHMPDVKHFSIPAALQQFASGGVLSGYTPGRDVHKFVSPTGGRLELSGGEAIMRPEWTAAVGRDFIDQGNAAASSGGVRAVRKFLSKKFGGDAGVDGRGVPQGFATGGIFSTAQLAEAQAFAKKHDYASYQMGAVGPSQFDCSGFMAAITHVLRNEYPYSRLGSTASFPWSGFNPGVGQFTIGSTSNYGGSGIGHMAGNVGGLNVESRGGAGVVLGAAARGYSDPGFNKIYYLGGKVGQATGDGGVVTAGGIKAPDWAIEIIKNPLKAVQHWIVDKWDGISDYAKSSPIWPPAGRTPLLAGKAVTDKVWDIIPGWAKTAAGYASDAAEWAVGGVKNAAGAVKETFGATMDFLGFADGGILPYNGTMKYDDGGYLPPGITSVVNMTRKPEPVFTSDQFDNMEKGGDGTLHYEPHFEGSNLTAEDVAADLNFTFRRIRRAGKYQEVGL